MTPPTGPLASAPQGSTHDFIRCLNLLADEPASFARATASWHAHWCLCVPQLTLADAAHARRGVDALAGPNAIPAAHSLRALFDRHGSHDLAYALEHWLDGHADSKAPT